MVWRMNCKDGKNGWMPTDQTGGSFISRNTGYDGLDWEGTMNMMKRSLFWIYFESKKAKLISL